MTRTDSPTRSGGVSVFPRSIAHDAVQVPEILVSEAPGPDSDLLEWVDRVIVAALKGPNGRSSPPPDQLAAQTLLRDALRYAQDWQGQLLQEHVDYIYDLETSYLVQSNIAKGEGTRSKWLVGGWGYSRTSIPEPRTCTGQIQALSLNTSAMAWTGWLGRPAEDRGSSAAVCEPMGSGTSRTAARHGRCRSAFALVRRPPRYYGTGRAQTDLPDEAVYRCWP